MANILSYIKTIWKAGKEGGTAWTPDRLNNIEGGIEQATNQINQNSQDIETLNSNLTNINSRLTEKQNVLSTGSFIFTAQAGHNIIKASNISSGKLPPTPRTALYKVRSCSSDNRNTTNIHTDGSDIIMNTNVAQSYGVFWVQF